MESVVANKNRKVNGKLFLSKRIIKAIGDIELSFLALPGILLVFVFSYLPMFGVILAFKKYDYEKGILGSEWIGMENFRFFFSYIEAWRVTRNTIGYNALFILLGTVFAVAFALMLNEIAKRTFVKIYQTIFFFPYFLSWVVVGYMFYAFFNMQYGIANGLLSAIGIEAKQWYADASYWPPILVLAYLWKNVGYLAIIYFAGLMGIDGEYYEAATIDGATKLQMIRHISIPLLMPLISVMTILAIGKIFYADFGMFFHLTRDVGLLYPTTDVIDTYVFRSLRKVGDVGQSAAVGLYQSTLGFIIVLVTNFIVKKYNSENALF